MTREGVGYAADLHAEGTGHL